MECTEYWFGLRNKLKTWNSNRTVDRPRIRMLLISSKVCFRGRLSMFMANISIHESTQSITYQEYIFTIITAYCSRRTTPTCLVVGLWTSASRFWKLLSDCLFCLFCCSRFLYLLEFLELFWELRLFGWSLAIHHSVIQIIFQTQRWILQN